MYKILILLLAGFLTLAVVIILTLGLYRQPHFIRHFEEQEYGKESPFLLPVSIDDGLAVYTVGEGDPVLLFPYPHGHTTTPMAKGPIADILQNLGYQVISFDVPGAFRSTRDPDGDMAEMIASADEALDRLGIEEPVPVVGHSMGGLAALGYAIERPGRIQKLILVTSLSGFPSAARWGFPGSAFKIYELDYWRIVIWGMKLNTGRGNLALHKRLQNLMSVTAFHKKTLANPVEIDPDDEQQGVPIRTIWSKNMYSRLSYADRLEEVQVPTLIIAGQHDPETPLRCAEELNDGISNSRLIVFEESGHYPFLEEADLFESTLTSFLNSTERNSDGSDFEQQHDDNQDAGNQKGRR